MGGLPPKLTSSHSLLLWRGAGKGFNSHAVLSFLQSKAALPRRGTQLGDAFSSSLAAVPCASRVLRAALRRSPAPANRAAHSCLGARWRTAEPPPEAAGCRDAVAVVTVAFAADWAEAPPLAW